MRDLYSEVPTRIVAELEAGAAPWIKPWSATVGQNMPQNAVTNRPYSGCNVILLWLARSRGWSTPRFLTFTQALEAGGNVRKGEHGTKVFFIKQLQIKDGDGEDDTRLIPMLREYTVFNVDQCENLPDSIKAGKPMRVRNPDTRDALGDEFLRSTGADIREGQGEAYYVPSHDFISMPAFNSSSAAICSGRSAVPGRTRVGRAGGATIHPITRRPSCSRTIRAMQSRWTAVPPSSS